MTNRKKLHNKNSTSNKKYGRNIYHKKHGQMIVLMGVILALAVFVLASLAAEITDLGITITSERANSLLPEFINVKETFGVSLNYNLIDDISSSDDPIFYYGDFEENFENTFDNTRDEYYKLELHHDLIFDAKLINYKYSHRHWNNYVYNAYVSLSLDYGDTYIYDNVTYLITCNPIIVYK